MFSVSRSDKTGTGPGMGFDFGLQDVSLCPPVKHRWLFSIDDISADTRTSFSANSLPPLKGARPNFSFKEIEVKHLTENIYYPIRPEWKPINLTLYDIKTNRNPVFEWIDLAYNAKTATWTPPGDILPGNITFMRRGLLALYDGCGNVIQEFVFDDCWPQSVNWGELDMGSSEIVTVDITLRYARAYFNSDSGNGNKRPTNVTTN